MKYSDVLIWIEQAFFPNRCMFCLKTIVPRQTICQQCAKTAPLTKTDVCLVCGFKKCICKDIYFTRLCSPFYYEMGVDNAIKYLKFRDYKYNAKKLALYMSVLIKKYDFYDEIDFIVAVPMHKTSRQNRGYNQAELLAKHMSSYLNIPYIFDVLIKIKKTKQQHKLDHIHRQTNLLNAFEVVEPTRIKDKTVLLVDDVYTTGATLNTCSKYLIENGAKEVYCVTAAKTRKND